RRQVLQPPVRGQSRPAAGHRGRDLGRLIVSLAERPRPINTRPINSLAAKTACVILALCRLGGAANCDLAPLSENAAGMVQADRKLVPIVSLDVVGYSRLVDHSEHQTLRLVRTVYEVLVARTIEEQGGKIFKTMGDGLLAEFQSVIAAVQWTASLQR